MRYFVPLGLPNRSCSPLKRLAVLEFAKECGFTLAEARQLFIDFRDEAPLSERLQRLARKKITELEALTEPVAVMKDLLERAQRCQCIDFRECGRRILDRVKRNPIPRGR